MTATGATTPARRPLPPQGAAIKHGAFISDLVDPRITPLAEQVFDFNPQLHPQRDRAAVLRYSMLLARIERVYCWLVEQDDLVFSNPRRGSVAHKIYDRLAKWEGAAERTEVALGISPKARVDLGLAHVQGSALVDHLRRTSGGNS